MERQREGERVEMGEEGGRKSERRTDGGGRELVEMEGGREEK